MSQQTGFPGGRYVQYSAPEIPKKRMHWFVKMLVALAVLMALGVVYGFWRISNVPSPELDAPATSDGTKTTSTTPTQR
jgi:hypothetical protein